MVAKLYISASKVYITMTDIKKSISHKLTPFVGVIIFGLAAVILYQQLKTYQYQDILQDVGTSSLDVLLLSIILTTGSYLIMMGYDVLAFRYLQKPLPFRNTALPSFLGDTVGNNVDFAFLTGRLIRDRFYSAMGISAVEIAQIVIFYNLTHWLGVVLVTGVIFLFASFPFQMILGLPQASIRIVGLLLVALISGYFVLVARQTTLCIRNWNVSPPRPRIAAVQLVFSVLNWIVASSVLYVLLPEAERPAWVIFLGLFLISQLVGLASTVPGGVGVFEATFLVLFPEPVPLSVISALIVYRIIYYLLPLHIALVIVGMRAIRLREAKTVQTVQSLNEWVPRIAPVMFATLSLVAGATLLFLNVIPTVRRFTSLYHVLPPSIIEMIRFLGSLIGVGLLVLARGLQRRLNGAYYLTVALLGLGVLLSILGFLNHIVLIVLGGLLAVFLPSRHVFYRTSSLTQLQFTPGWIAAIISIFVTTIWLGVFTHQRIGYSIGSWWQFVLREEVPWILRIAVGAASLLIIITAVKLIGPAPPTTSLPTAKDIDSVRPIIERSPELEANLALLRDKSLLFSENGEAFLMYGVERRSWVAMGGPFGATTDRTEVAWLFRELSSRHGGRTVFYEVGADELPLMIDLGLSVYKIGERGRVPLQTFSLEGSARADFRRTCRKVEHAGYTFEIVPREEVPALIPELRAVSNAWLSTKNTREKGFSLGFFNEDYITNFPVAVIRSEEQLVAFANIWSGPDNETLTVDLIRYSDEAPKRTMDYLLIQLMLSGRDQGYQWFSLGMAPLSGLEDRPLAPLWNRIGTFIFHHGEHFYNYQGLRLYKDKYDPVWEPRYLACPDGLALPIVLFDVATLISGGERGIVLR